MATVRRLVFGLAFLALAILLAQHSAGLPRSAWFAKANYMVLACACGAVPINLLMRSIKIPPNRFSEVWWKVAPVLACVGVVLMWGSFIAIPHTASKPIAWVLNVGCTLCLWLLLRIRKWAHDARTAR